MRSNSVSAAFSTSCFRVYSTAALPSLTPKGGSLERSGRDPDLGPVGLCRRRSRWIEAASFGIRGPVSNVCA